jgi:hypothetical protein
MANGSAASAAQEKINIDIVTLTRFLTEEQTKHKEATGDFTYAVYFLEFPNTKTNGLLIASFAMLCNSRSNLLPTISVEQV